MLNSLSLIEPKFKVLDADFGKKEKLEGRAQAVGI